MLGIENNGAGGREAQRAVSDLIVDAPDNESATAVALTVNAAEGATVKDRGAADTGGVDAAAKRSVEYRPPGA